MAKKRLRRGFSWRSFLIVESTNWPILETYLRIVDSLAGYHCGSLRAGKHSNPKHKPSWRYDICSSPALLKILGAIRLVGKEQQRQLVLKAVSLMPTRHDIHPNTPWKYDADLFSLFAEIKKLNKRGSEI